MSTNVMYKKRIYTANDLVSALTEMGKMCGSDLDQIYLENANLLTAKQVVLTDRSKVYDVRLDFVGPDQNVPFNRRK